MSELPEIKEILMQEDEGKFYFKYLSENRLFTASGMESVILRRSMLFNN